MIRFGMIFFSPTIFLVGLIELTTVISSLADSQKEQEIVFVSVIFRHGDRAPDNNGNELYPNDPYKNYNYYPVGFGGLSKEGKKREYQLGCLLREKYNDFLGEIYLPSLVKGISTDYDRTKMSLMIVLSALFPPKGIQIWNPKINWQPIPISYFPAKDDILMSPDGCPLYLKELKRVKNLKEVQEEIDKFRPLMKNLTLLTGKKIEVPLDMFNLYHTLMSEQSWNLTLPKWASEIFPYGELWNGTVLEYKIKNYNTNLRRLFGGMLLRNITDQMRGIIRNDTDGGRKINLYSGHETNIASFLMTLGVYEPHVPAYTSAVIVELLRDKKSNYYVQLQYYWGIPSKIHLIQIPGCDVNCPIDKFMELLEDVIPQDSDMICLR